MAMSMSMAWIARQRDVNAIIATAAQSHMHANHDQFSTKLGSTKNKEAGFVVIIPTPTSSPKAKTWVLAGMKSDGWASVRFYSGCNPDSSR